MKQHYVEPNQTAAIVAEKYGISVEELVKLNSELEETIIYTGMLLKVPGEEANSTERAFIDPYNLLALSIHMDNVRKGFWPEGGRSDGRASVEGQRNVGVMLMLVVTELSEALEADRKKLMDDKLTHHKGVTVEIADAIIRLMDLGYGLGLPVAEAMAEKLAYNRTRPFKHGKAY